MSPFGHPQDVGENLSRDAQNAMFKAADTVRAGTSCDDLGVSWCDRCLAS